MRNALIGVAKSSSKSRKGRIGREKNELVRANAGDDDCTPTPSSMCDASQVKSSQVKSSQVMYRLDLTCDANLVAATSNTC